MHTVLAAAQVGACGVVWVGVEGRVASSVSSPGSQALLVAGQMSRVGRARCRPAHFHTVSLVWHYSTSLVRSCGSCWVLL